MPNDKRSQNQQLLEASSLGLMFPIAIGIGFGMGYGMDKLFHTRWWMTVIFTVFGLIAAFINLFRTGMGNDGGTPPTTPT
jgi:ATP synthase protein I